MESSEYQRLKKLTEDNLESYLPQVDERSGILREAMLYSLKAGGKRLRPVLLLAACELCGGDINRALPFACAIEFIHTYSLIHDDHPSMDNDDFRRGRLTNHKIFGDDMAILAGDGLLNSAFDIMFSQTVESGRPEAAKAALEISQAAGTGGMVSGQVSDVIMTSENEVLLESRVEFSSRLKESFTSEEMLKYIHKNKTGALIRAAVRAGAIIAEADEETLDALTEYAENIGLTFQIVDDILDVKGDEAQLGKKTGVDEKAGKLTYPSVYGLEKSFEKAKQVTEKAVSAISHMGGKKEFLIKLALDLQMRIS